MVFKSLPNLLSTLTTISKTTHDLLSTILIAQDSHGDNPLYASTALTLASSFAPPALAAITIHQALETNTQLRQISSHLGTISDTLARDNALRVASEFPTLVYNMLQHKIKSEPSSIWYLVYHPDTIWRHHFEDLVLNRGVLGERFIGIFGSLDAVVIYMQAMRKAGVGRGGGGEGEVHFRLLVPAYYPITVETPVRFPVESIEPFDVYCDVHNGVPLVSMFLPGVREGELGNVGLWKPQRGFWEQLFGIGSGQDENPRLLGMQLLHDGENVNMDGLAIHDQSIDGDKIGQSGEQVQVQEKMREVLAEDPMKSWSAPLQSHRPERQNSIPFDIIRVDIRVGTALHPRLDLWLAVTSTLFTRGPLVRAPVAQAGDTGVDIPVGMGAIEARVDE
ncbi:hypothetical protein CBS147343_10409 [Aspergillus niger]|nr:hypothetical protein CBS133816_3263 [Aspergillus niger]KAI2930393.1 hypothetical protein CBS147321_10519 [Aspergillus niger]KAI2952258.1 hypothetical protein CBS147323_10338 [Aspergillus niger]KAI2959726.1 hypothetical protein CBS147324_10233 [Aspergillus niger]KAI2982912.1 hypothetical protein CBS147482_10121 [Aspergillus niger]